MSLYKLQNKIIELIETYDHKCTDCTEDHYVVLGTREPLKDMLEELNKEIELIESRKKEHHKRMTTATNSKMFENFDIRESELDFVLGEKE